MGTAAISGPDKPGLLIPLLAGGVAVALAVIRPVFPVDDAYITLHNARALLAGGADPVYGGTAVDGATSLVHLALVAGFGLVFPLELGSNILTVLAVMAYALGLVQLARLLEASPWLVAGLGLLSAYLPYSLTNGLETGIAMAVVTWLIVLANSRHLGWLAGLAPFVRPELGLLAALLMARRLWLDRASASAMAGSLGRAVLVALPFFLWSWVMTGALVPATGGAKVAFFAEISLPLLTKLRLAGWGLMWSMMIPLFIGLYGLAKPAARPLAGPMLLAWVVLWLLASLWALPTGYGHNFHRYLAPLVPALLVGWVVLSRQPGWWRKAFLVMMIVSLGTGVLGLRARVRSNRSDTMLVMADMSRRLIPPGTTVLIHDAGYLAWARPDLTLVDVVGLKSKANIEVHERLTRRSRNRAPAFVEIAGRSGATMMVLYDKDGIWGGMVTALRGAGWTAEKLAPSPRNTYSFYRITPPQEPRP